MLNSQKKFTFTRLVEVTGECTLQIGHKENVSVTLLRSDGIKLHT